MLSRSGVRETHPETDSANSGLSGLKEAEEALLGKEAVVGRPLLGKVSGEEGT